MTSDFFIRGVSIVGQASGSQLDLEHVHTEHADLRNHLKAKYCVCYSQESFFGDIADSCHNKKVAPIVGDHPIPTSPKGDLIRLHKIELRHDREKWHMDYTNSTQVPFTL